MKDSDTRGLKNRPNTTAEPIDPDADRSDTSDSPATDQGKRAARAAPGPDRVVDPDAVAGQNPAELSDAQLRALYETHDFTGVEIARLLEVGESAVYERLYQCEWYEGELARRLRHQAHPDPHDESDLRADGGYPIVEVGDRVTALKPDGDHDYEAVVATVHNPRTIDAVINASRDGPFERDSYQDDYTLLTSLVYGSEQSGWTAGWDDE